VLVPASAAGFTGRRALLPSEEVKADAGLTDFVRDRPEGRGVVSFDGDERSFTPVDRLRVVAVLASAVRGLVVPAVRSVMVPVVRMVTGLVEGEGLIREAGAVGFRFSVMAEPVVRFGSRCSDAVFLSVGSSVIFSVSISCSHSCGVRGVLFDLGVRGGSVRASQRLRRTRDRREAVVRVCGSSSLP